MAEHFFDFVHDAEPDNVRELALKLAIDRGGQTTPVSDYDVCCARKTITGEAREIDRLRGDFAEARKEIRFLKRKETSK